MPENDEQFKTMTGRWDVELYNATNAVARNTGTNIPFVLRQAYIHRFPPFRRSDPNFNVKEWIAESSAIISGVTPQDKEVANA